jgi:hypothetical protein
MEPCSSRFRNLEVTGMDWIERAAEKRDVHRLGNPTESSD